MLLLTQSHVPFVAARRQVLSGQELARAMAKGGVVDLGSREIVLSRKLVVRGEGAVATVRNGQRLFVGTRRTPPPHTHHHHRPP